MERMTTSAAAKLLGAQKLDSGRYVIGRWNERAAQWQGVIRPSPWPGYQFSFARTAEGLAREIGDISAATLRRRAKKVAADNAVAEAYTTNDD